MTDYKIDIKSIDITSLMDNTLLNQDASDADIVAFVEASLPYRFASLCIAPSWIALASSIAKGVAPLTTVVGFPLGANTTAIKSAETEQALHDGATEIDMVINIGMLKSKNYKYLLDEIKAIKNICVNNVLKCIIETCLLTSAEIVTISKIIADSGADFVKTSTGFSKAGANEKDVKLIRENVPDSVKIKAAGGIRTLSDVTQMLAAGANRIGTSKGINIIKEYELYNKK